VRIIAPVFVFTAQELWQNMPKKEKDGNIDNVHLLGWPQVDPEFSQSNLSPERNIGAELKIVLELIPDIAKALEEKRGQDEIGSSFDAKINVLTNSQERYKFLGRLQGDLCEIFKVSQVEIKFDPNLPNLDKGVRNTTSPDIRIEVGKAEGQKCARCWNYSVAVGKSKAHPSICENCLLAIGEE
jgi:isoleucyl-tRNA synthetase